MQGRVVRHPQYGIGKVVQTRYSNLELRVEFDNGVGRWVRREQIVEIAPETSLDFQVGDWVNHRRYGVGKVVSIKPDKYEEQDTWMVTVLFPDINEEKTFVQSIARLERVSVPPSVTSPVQEVVKPAQQLKLQQKPARKTYASVPDDSFDYRRMIEAFRLGIVPYDCIEEFTFGREREIEQLVSWCKAPDESVIQIIGEYGSGKTHLLDYLYWRALKEGFAVARVEMDPNETPFHQPKRVYNRLVSSLRFLRDTGKHGCFRDLVQETIDKGGLADHKHFRYLGRDAPPEVPKEELWNWIEAQDDAQYPLVPTERFSYYYPIKPGLPTYLTAANIYCYLLSALGWSTVEFLGLQGLLLIFDESESVHLSYGYQFKKGTAFARSLVATARNDPRMLREPSTCIHSEDFAYSKRASHIPFLYRAPCNMKIVFAFADDNASETLFGQMPGTGGATGSGVDKGMPSVRLSTLSRTALKEIPKHITYIYGKAYNALIEPDTSAFSQLYTQRLSTRQLVKACVEVLDCERCKAWIR